MASILICESVLCTSIYILKIYRILALTLKGKLGSPTTLEIPGPMSTLGLQDKITFTDTSCINPVVRHAS